MIAEIGRLTKDVTTRTVTVGDTERIVLNNRLAIPIGQDKAAFIDITCWGRLAELIAQHFQKGDELYIEGYMRSRDYVVEGKTIQMPYVLVETMKFTHGQSKKEESV